MRQSPVRCVFGVTAKRHPDPDSRKAAPVDMAQNEKTSKPLILIVDDAAENLQVLKDNPPPG